MMAGICRREVRQFLRLYSVPVKAIAAVNPDSFCAVYSVSGSAIAAAEHDGFVPYIQFRSRRLPPLKPIIYLVSLKSFQPQTPRGLRCHHHEN
jgi:hypothetical protein